MRLLSTLFFCLFLLVACSKEETTPNASPYFIGTWQLRANPLSPNSGTTVTFDKTGKATFHLAYATNPDSRNVTRNFSYNAETKELIFDSPVETYKVIEKLTNQFTVVTLGTNKGIIFMKE